MKKIGLTLCSLSLFIASECFGQQLTLTNEKKQTVTKGEDNQNTEATILDFVVVDIEGNKFDFATLRDKKVMIVNTASQCGLTPQYEELELLYQKYKDYGFVIVGFPANNFNEQEPGSDKEIQAFCQSKYGVTFPMMSKISVQGKDMHPLYQFLTDINKNGIESSEVAWNFQKYLIGRDGKLEKVISPKVTPMSDEIITWITSK